MPKGIDLDLSSGFKTCPACRESKPLSAYHTSRRTKHGFAVYCKPCTNKRTGVWRKNNMARAAVLQKKWRDTNPRRSKDYTLRMRYGLPLGEYDKMFAQQEGRCAICRSDKAGGKGGDLHVDHCHETGKVRGLLCHGCNVSIGHFHHDPGVLQAAIRYLNQTQN